MQDGRGFYMEILISNILIIRNPTKEITEYIKKAYTYNNPSYIKKQRMGFSTYKTARYIRLYDLDDTGIYLPIGCFYDIFKIHPIIEDYRDLTVRREINVDSRMKLRDYQKYVITACRKYQNGLIVMPCGTGKSISMLQTACELKQKTLWLCTTRELLIQAESYIKDYTNATTSRITEGKCDYSGDFVFATIQTLCKVIDKLEIPQDTFGCIIGDEIQHCMISDESVMMFKTCFEYFSAKYKFGCTATLKTANDLWKCIPKIVGKVIYELRKEKNELIGYYEGNDVIRVPLELFQTPARVFMVNTNYKPGDDCYDSSNRIIYSKLISEIVMDKKRNDMILDICNRIDGYTIIVSERTNQLEYLESKLNYAIRIDSKMKKSVREEVVNDFRKGKYKYLLATYSLIAEGFDVPMLENLIMASPIKDERLVIQSVGRCQRPYEGKKIANVYDFYDDVGILYNKYRNRMKVYKKENWEVI